MHCSIQGQLAAGICRDLIRRGSSGEPGPPLSPPTQHPFASPPLGAPFCHAAWCASAKGEEWALMGGGCGGGVGGGRGERSRDTVLGG